MDVEKQIRFLESQDIRISEDAKQALILQINCGNGIPNLVNYYAENRSERVLDLLCKIREPHEKVLLDTLHAAILKERKFQEALILLGQILQQSPSWTPKIAHHTISKCILDHVKNIRVGVTTPNDCIAGLLFLTLLLPHCCALPSPMLTSMFTTFLCCCEAYAKMKNSKSKTPVDRVTELHMAFGLREYFQCLYGIYPCNFLTFLRTFFEKQGKRKEVTDVVRSFMNDVRLHPNLVFASQESECASERWSQRTPHDFLDEIRRIVVGVIPVPVNIGFERASEPDSPSVTNLNNQASFSSLPYGADNSSTSSNFAWSAFDGCDNLLETINTPPGSVLGTPTSKRNTVDETTSPLVITSEERPKRERAATEVVRGFRLGSISSIGNAIKRNIVERRSVVMIPSFPQRAQANLIEIECGNEEGRRSSECDQNCDEAEEAIDNVPPMESPHDRRPTRLYTSSQASSSTVVDEEMLSPSSTDSRPATASEIAEEHRASSAKLTEAVAAARNTVRLMRRMELEQEEKPVFRERSSSLMPQSSAASEEPRTRTHTMDAGLVRNTDSETGDFNSDAFDSGRNRFSVTSYFTKLNRQRFVSECPPVLPDLDTSTTAERGRRLERTLSCPTLTGDAELLGKQAKGVHLNAPAPPVVDLMEKFPYLKLVAPLQPIYLKELEEKLALEHKSNLEGYMESSRSYHNRLKELGLADRLPGRIYDDMNQITVGLTPEKQRDILSARLQLVNQHLMYERSCRMLHANRNRWLFGMIKQHEVADKQLTNALQTIHHLNKEVSSLRTGLTQKRKELIDMKHRHDVKYGDYMNKRQTNFEDYHAKIREASAQEDRILELEKMYKEAKHLTDTYRRRADDADVNCCLMMKQMENLRTEIADLKSSHIENQQLRDQLALSDRGDDRLKSPEMDDRNRAVREEAEKARRERDKERHAREEIKERNNQLEAAFKEEQRRSNQLNQLVDRQGRLLKEQNEAAEQKFLSLQLVTQKQEEYINQLYVELETARDTVLIAAKETADRSSSPPSLSIPRHGVTPEISYCGSTASEPLQSYFIRDNRNPTPMSSSIDDHPIDY